MGLGLEDLGEAVRERIVAYCRDREPSAVGILVHGSYATSTAQPESDIDIDIFTTGDSTVHYRTWFEERPSGTPLHVSARSDLTLEEWEDEGKEPEEWSLGLPVEMHFVWLWVGDEELVEVLGQRPVLRKPGGSPEIEEWSTPSSRCVGTQRQATIQSAVRDPRSALDAILSLPLTPPTWAEDLPRCLGLTNAQTDEVVNSANSVALATLQLARNLNPDVDGQPEVSRYTSVSRAPRR
jgi:predicted nucleotidyltransferase